MRPERRDASLRRLDAGDRVAERPRLGQQLRLARRPPERKIGTDHLRRRGVDRYEAAVLLQHGRRIPLRMVRWLFPTDETSLAEAQDSAALFQARLVAGEAPQDLEHRIDRVMLGRIGVGRTRLDVLELPVPVPIRKRMRLQPREAGVGGLRPTVIPRGHGECVEESERLRRHKRVLADRLTGRKPHLERPTAVGTARLEVGLADAARGVEKPAVVRLAVVGDESRAHIGRVEEHDFSPVLDGPLRLVSDHRRTILAVVGRIASERLAPVCRRPSGKRRVLRLQLRQEIFGGRLDKAHGFCPPCRIAPRPFQHQVDVRRMGLRDVGVVLVGLFRFALLDKCPHRGQRCHVGERLQRRLAVGTRRRGIRPRLELRRRLRTRRTEPVHLRLREFRRRSRERRHRADYQQFPHHFIAFLIFHFPMSNGR